MKEPWNFEDPLCKEIGTDVFYTDKRAVPENINLIRVLCNRCPAKTDCLEWAIHNERFGVWAGTTENQRNIIRRKRNIILKEEDVA